MQSGKIWKNRGLHTVWKNDRTNLQKKLIQRKNNITAMLFNFISILRVTLLIRLLVYMWARGTSTARSQAWSHSRRGSTATTTIRLTLSLLGTQHDHMNTLILTNHFACSLQELDMSAESLLLREMVSRSAPWSEAIAQTLNAKPELVEYYLVRAVWIHYTAQQHWHVWQVTTKQLVGVLLIVFVNKKHVSKISEVQSTITTTGIMGVMVRIKVSY